MRNLRWRKSFAKKCVAKNYIAAIAKSRIFNVLLVSHFLLELFVCNYCCIRRLFIDMHDLGTFFLIVMTPAIIDFAN